MADKLRPIGTRFHYTCYTSPSTNGHWNMGKIIYEYEVIGYEHVFENGIPVKRENYRIVSYSYDVGNLKYEKVIEE